MAAIGQYLMERSAEIQLARSAAPASISRDATILVLGRQGYETAVEGKNGFDCIVARGWMAAFDRSEFWNPKVRAADCMNPQAARAISSKEPSQMKGLPPILVFLVGAANWSDGTPAGKHDD